MRKMILHLDEMKSHFVNIVPIVFISFDIGKILKQIRCSHLVRKSFDLFGHGICIAPYNTLSYCDMFTVS